MQLFNSQKLIRSSIDKFLTSGAYTLHKVYDGTIVNIYYYKNSWRISTNKAYDATDLMFVNGKTYTDVLEEILTQYKEFSFDKLSHDKCYTICFKYSEYHPFIENQFKPKNKIIFIQSVDMKKFNEENKLEVNQEEDIGLPLSEQYHLAKNDTVNTITNNLNNEIARFKKQHKDADYEPNYGLILRSADFGKTTNYTNILLESNIMSKIRNFVYNHNLKKNLDFYDKLNNAGEISIDKGYYDVSHITNLKVFLGGKDVNLYLLLFPQYKAELTMYNSFLKPG